MPTLPLPLQLSSTLSSINSVFGPRSASPSHSNEEMLIGARGLDQSKSCPPTPTRSLSFTERFPQLATALTPKGGPFAVDQWDIAKPYPIVVEDCNLAAQVVMVEATRNPRQSIDPAFKQQILRVVEGYRYYRYKSKQQKDSAGHLIRCNSDLMQCKNDLEARTKDLKTVISNQNYELEGLKRREQKRETQVAQGEDEGGIANRDEVIWKLQQEVKTLKHANRGREERIEELEQEVQELKDYLSAEGDPTDEEAIESEDGDTEIMVMLDDGSRSGQTVVAPEFRTHIFGNGQRNGQGNSKDSDEPSPSLTRMHSGDQGFSPPRATPLTSISTINTFAAQTPRKDSVMSPEVQPGFQDGSPSSVSLLSQSVKVESAMDKLRTACQAAL